MKSYLFLMLLIFIACNVEKKTEEIVLKDANHEILKKIAKIFAYCGAENGDCFIAKLNELYDDLTFEQSMALKNFELSPQCQNDCVNIFSDELKDKSLSETLCNIYICLK